MCNFLLVNIYEIYITIIYVTNTWYDLLVLVMYMTPLYSIPGSAPGTGGTLPPVP